MPTSPTSSADPDVLDCAASSLTMAVQDLTVVRAGRMLFTGLRFQAQAGDLVLLEGPNGVGKSSLLRVLGGFLDPYEGTISALAAGEPVNPADMVALLEEAPALKPSETLEETLLFFRSLTGLEPISEARLDAVEKAARQFHVTALLDSETRYLSTGQRKRAALARLSLSARPIWLLDEPQNGLDTASRELLAEALSSHLERGGIALVASHDALPIEPSQRINLADYLSVGEVL